MLIVTSSSYRFFKKKMSCFEILENYFTSAGRCFNVFFLIFSSFNNSDFSSENKRSKKKREVKGKDKSGRKSKEGSPLSEEDNHHENPRENSKNKKQVLSLTQSLVLLT